MKPLTTVFLLTLILVVPVVAHAGAVVPLEWYQAGHVKPGYEITVQLHAVGMTSVPIPISHAFADAGLEFQGHRYGVIGSDGGGPTVEVYYYIDGQQIKIDEFHYGKKEYDAYVKITAYCPGEQPSGAPSAPPSDDYFWVRVDFNGQYERWNLLRLGGDANTGVPLQLFYESTPGLESWARISDSLHFKDCGNIIGNPPSPGDDTRSDGGPGNNWKDLAKYLGIVLVALAIILILKP